MFHVHFVTFEAECYLLPLLLRLRLFISYTMHPNNLMRLIFISHLLCPLRCQFCKLLVAPIALPLLIDSQAILDANLTALCSRACLQHLPLPADLHLILSIECDIKEAKVEGAALLASETN